MQTSHITIDKTYLNPERIKVLTVGDEFNQTYLIDLKSEKEKKQWIQKFDEISQRNKESSMTDNNDMYVTDQSVAPDIFRRTLKSGVYGYKKQRRGRKSHRPKQIPYEKEQKPLSPASSETSLDSYQSSLSSLGVFKSMDDLSSDESSKPGSTTSSTTTSETALDPGGVGSSGDAVSVPHQASSGSSITSEGSSSSSKSSITHPSPESSSSDSAPSKSDDRQVSFRQRNTEGLLHQDAQEHKHAEKTYVSSGTTDPPRHQPDLRDNRASKLHVLHSPYSDVSYIKRTMHKNI